MATAGTISFLFTESLIIPVGFKLLSSRLTQKYKVKLLFQVTKVEYNRWAEIAKSFYERR